MLSFSHRTNFKELLLITNRNELSPLAQICKRPGLIKDMMIHKADIGAKIRTGVMFCFLEGVAT